MTEDVPHHLTGMMFWRAGAGEAGMRVGRDLEVWVVGWLAEDARLDGENAMVKK